MNYLEQARDWLIFWYEDADAGLPSKEAIESLSVVLSDVAKEARLEEATWWNVYSGQLCKGKEDCSGCERMEYLKDQP